MDNYWLIAAAALVLWSNKCKAQNGERLICDNSINLNIVYIIVIMYFVVCLKYSLFGSASPIFSNQI